MSFKTPPEFQGPSRSSDPYQGGYMTKHGWFSHQDIADMGGRENYDSNGELLIQFPVRSSPTMGPQYRDIPAHVVDEHMALAEKAKGGDAP
jgi:hypothetical protein